jgi:hypothetical protein
MDSNNKPYRVGKPLPRNLNTQNLWDEVDSDYQECKIGNPDLTKLEYITVNIQDCKHEIYEVGRGTGLTNMELIAELELNMRIYFELKGIKTTLKRVAIAHAYGAVLDAKNISEWSDTWSDYGKRFSSAQLLKEYKLYLSDKTRLSLSNKPKQDKPHIKDFLMSIELVRIMFPDGLQIIEADLQKLLSSYKKVYGKSFSDD